MQSEGGSLPPAHAEGGDAEVEDEDEEEEEDEDEQGEADSDDSEESDDEMLDIERKAQALDADRRAAFQLAALDSLGVLSFLSGISGP
jgi:DNA-directed RNA polymerase specialized sigma24 family protein